MKPSQALKTLRTCLDKRLRVMLAGPPGVGKSDIFAQAAAEAGIDLEIWHPSTWDVVDARGLPYASADGRASFLPYGDLRRAMEASKPLAILLDDLGQAPPAVQAALMQLILSNRVGEHHLPPHVCFYAATNRREDRAAVSALIEPVKSRFHSIISLDVDLDDWTLWAYAHSISPEVVAYLRFRPDALHEFRATTDVTNSPCPRTWKHVSDLLQAGLSDDETLAGAVGKGRASEFREFLKIFRSLPDLDGCILQPDTSPIPSGTSARIACAVGLAARCTTRNFGQIVRYVERISKEVETTCVNDCYRREKGIANTQAWQQWVAKNGEYV
jgi:hypothetical protein